jgi:ABC-2 type transport system ATP-binding protein
MSTILKVDNLVKKYGDFEAVKGISFSVEEGEVFGLLGPNGAGKTTAISMLTGVLPPTSGSAQIAGHDIRTGQGTQGARGRRATRRRPDRPRRRRG